MTRTTHFEVIKQTRAGTVRGSLTLSLEGSPDGIAVVDRELVAHLLAAPVEVTPSVVEAPPTWESETLRLAAFHDGTVGVAGQ